MIAALVLAAAIAIPPRPKDFVTDNAAALSSGAVSSVSSELKSYYDATGNTVFVWIGQSTGDQPLEEWTVDAATKWKIGSKGKDNGAVLFLFMKDRKIRIEVGYGLEGSLPDASASEIVRNTIAPKMRAGDVDGAVQSGVDAMLVTITPSYAQKLGRAVPAPNSEAQSPDAEGIGFIIFVVVVALLLMIRLRGKGRGAGGAWYWGPGISMGGFGGGGGGFSGGFGGGFGGGGASGGW